MLSSQEICGLLASRICHDLVNPVGAISNGLELVSLETRLASSAELALVRESVESANARLRLIRLAFGAASPSQYLARSEIVSVLEDWVPNNRLSVEWQAEGDHPRLDVRRVVLAVMCCETALPMGGLLRVARLPEYWQISARGPKLRIEDDLWALVTRPGTDAQPDVAPARVQFVLLQADLADSQAAARLTSHEGGFDLVLPVRLV